MAKITLEVEKTDVEFVIKVNSEDKYFIECENKSEDFILIQLKDLIAFLILKTFEIKD